MDQLQKNIKLTQTQIRTFRFLVGGEKATLENETSILVNNKRVCALQTIQAMVRKGVVNEVILDELETYWEINEVGKKLASLIFPVVQEPTKIAPKRILW